jgi:hypothetical protein
MTSRFLLAGAAMAAILAGSAPALAAGCTAAGAMPLAVGSLQTLAPNAAGTYGVDLAAGQGVLIELTNVNPAPGSEDEHEEGAPAPAPLAVMVCDAKGALLAPLPSDVFASGGSMSRDDGTLTLRFVAPAAGRYTVVAPAVEAPRELLLRGRDLPAADSKATELELGGSDFAKVSAAKPLLYAFTAKAGQWVKITANSDNDTVLHLAAPLADGTYEVIADNDDSDGTNPMIRRRLPASGTYYVQVESLTGDENDVTVLVQPTQAPPPPPAPAALKLGTAVDGKLADAEAKVVYSLPVQAGHAYRVELTAPYDAVIEVGTDNPLVAEDGEEGNGFNSIQSRDANLTGTEKLTFTARSTGRVLVQVRAYGLGDADGSYKLVAVDTGM